MKQYAYRKEDRKKRAKKEITEQSKKLGLENKYIQDISISLLVDIWEKGLMQGRRIDYMAQIALYIKSRKAGIPICLQNLNMKNKTARKYLKAIKKETNLELDMIKTLHIIEYLTPDKNIHKLAEKIKKKIEHTGRSPRAEASGILYLILEDCCTQKEIAKVTNMTELTVRKTYKQIKEKLNNPEQYKYRTNNPFSRTLKFEEKKIGGVDD